MESKDKTSSSTNSMFGPVEEQVKGYLGGVGRVYNNGSRLPQRNAQTNWAMTQTRKLAKKPVPGLDAAQSMVNGYMQNNGMTPDMLANADILKGIAEGNQVEDPRLQQLLNTNAERAANAAATRFGGGKYGTAGIGINVGNAVADANNGVMLQSNENARGRQMQAAGLLGQMYDGGAARAMQAGAMIPSLNNLRYDGASRMAGVGDFYTGFKQDQLQNYAGALAPFLSAGGTTTSRTPGASGAQSILGGAMMGGKVGSSFGPWGTLAGMAGGGILGGWG